MTAERIFKSHTEADYPPPKPLPDPEKIIDMNQEPNLTIARYMLKDRFSDRDDVLVSGDGYLCFDTSTMREDGWLVPDCVVAFGVSPQPIYDRNGYVISEVGKSPDLVLEVASRSTGRRDYTVKREGYARYGVREYWRFDPSGGDYHDAPLGGDTLVDGEYEPIEIVSESETRHWGYSEVLGLEIWWHEGFLRLRDPVSGEFLHRTPEESEEAIEAAEASTESERVARIAAERRAEAERAARVSYEARMAEMEAELRRLRGE